MTDFQPLPPKVKFIQNGKWMYCILLVHVGPGQTLGFRSRTDMSQMEQQMRDGAEIGGLFGVLFKGIKKVVGTVSKVTGLGKALGAASTILKNPIINTILPVAGKAGKGLDIAKNLLTAQVAKTAGKPDIASKALALAAVQTQKAGLDVTKYAKASERTYQLIIRPN